MKGGNMEEQATITPKRPRGRPVGWRKVKPIENNLEAVEKKVEELDKVIN